MLWSLSGRRTNDLLRGLMCLFLPCRAHLCLPWRWTKHHWQQKKKKKSFLIEEVGLSVLLMDHPKFFFLKDNINWTYKVIRNSKKQQSVNTQCFKCNVSF